MGKYDFVSTSELIRRKVFEENKVERDKKEIKRLQDSIDWDEQIIKEINEELKKRGDLIV